MEDVSVFLVDCELSGESLQLRKNGYAGAFVTCIIATTNITEALELAQHMLGEDGYIITDIEKAERFHADEWTDEPEIASLVSEVRSTGEKAYSAFDVWGH